MTKLTACEQPVQQAGAGPERALLSAALCLLPFCCRSALQHAKQ